MPANVTNWTELREFRAVDLTRSFVLSWEVASGTLRIDLDLCLCPEHAFYEPPRPKEGACIRPAMLEFPYCSGLADGATGSDDSAPAAIAAGLVGGRIAGLRLVDDGCYEMNGTFGTVEIRAERPILRLKSLMT